MSASSIFRAGEASAWAILLGCVFGVWRGRLPDAVGGAGFHVSRRLRARGRGRLTGLAAELDTAHPSAGASVREGLQDRLAVLRLGVPPTLVRTLRLTNAVESMISIARDCSSNVKRWRDGTMALRWYAAEMVDAGKQFRRVNGHLHLYLRTRRCTGMSAPRTSSPTGDDHTVSAAGCSADRHRSSTELGTSSNPAERTMSTLVELLRSAHWRQRRYVQGS